jgi:NADH:ubiquinone oxidoreductase subunit F (NADH-binding)/NADH:ubiquinone oxidoreductase subunit E
MLIEELQSIQRQHGYLPVEELHTLSERTGAPLYQVHGLASFFPHFRLAPPAPVEVRVCSDMSCHLHDADGLRRDVEARMRQLGPAGGMVQSTSCLGRCDRAPAASVNDAIFTGLTPDALYGRIEAVAAGRVIHAEDRASVTDLAADPYHGRPRYTAVRQLAADGDVAGALSALKASGLRGMGGAGFPTATKWELVRNAPGDTKYVVCNADESEPGTIKDRFILEHAAHLVIEGIMLAQVITGASKGIIYIRHEYEAQREILERELEQCRRDGLLGRAIPGLDLTLDVSVFVSPGGYICGEESALLEVLEDKRAEPRNKPPFPVSQGLHHKPTVINNVETFAFVPGILVNGAGWFKAQGRSGSIGLKFVGVSGHVARPGVYEVPMGMSVREVIFDLAGGVPGGRALKAFASSGASSGFLPASAADVALDFKSLDQAGSMLGSGAIVVCAEGTCMLDMALNAQRFFKNESCGKCVPCRVGSAKVVDVLTDIAEGRGRPEHLLLIDELSHAMALTSICGLGQFAPKPIASVLKHFRAEVDDHILRQHCPSGVCPMV